LQAVVTRSAHDGRQGLKYDDTEELWDMSALSIKKKLLLVLILIAAVAASEPKRKSKADTAFSQVPLLSTKLLIQYAG
jgi:hypothetical protein